MASDPRAKRIASGLPFGSVAITRLVIAVAAMVTVSCATTEDTATDASQDTKAGGAASMVGAQDPRLVTRLNAATLAIVQGEIDSANKVKLPGSMLADKALELQARGVEDSAIVNGVRGLRGNLTVARASLGENSTTTELRAGTSAIDAGSSGSELGRVRAAGAKRPLAQPLIVLADLIADNVPVGKAGDLVVSMLKAGVTDIDFVKFQRDVNADIAHGATDPGVVATARAKAAIDRVPKAK